VIDDSDSFVVEGFEVITVREFCERFAGSNALNMRLAFKTKYKTRLNAEKAARKACEEAVEAARFNLTLLKKTLKVTRPWEIK
jgi:predicted RNA polymerase sigma factor